MKNAPFSANCRYCITIHQGALSRATVCVSKPFLFQIGDDDVISEELDRIIQHVTYVKYKGTVNSMVTHDVASAVDLQYSSRYDNEFFIVAVGGLCTAGVTSCVVIEFLRNVSKTEIPVCSRRMTLVPETGDVSWASGVKSLWSFSLSGGP